MSITTSTSTNHLQDIQVGDIHCCGLFTDGKRKDTRDDLRARKVGQLFGQYDKAAYLEDGRIYFLDGELVIVGHEVKKDEEEDVLHGIVACNHHHHHHHYHWS